MLMCKGLWFVMIKCLIVEGTLGLDSWFSSLSIFWPSRFHPWLGMTFFMCGLSHKSPVYITFQTWRSHISQTCYIIFRTWRSQKFDPGYVIFPTWRTYKIKTGYVFFHTCMKLELNPDWLCHFPDREISGNPKLEMSFSKHGDNINPSEVIYLPNLENWNIHDWMLCRSYLGYCDFHVLPVLDTDMRQVWNLS